MQAPCRVDQAAQQPAQCAPRRRVIVRLKVPNSLGTMQKPALAQPPPAAAPPHCSERLLPPKHVWGAKQPPQEHMPPRGDVRTSPHKRAWRLEQPGADVQPPRADEYLPLPTGGSPVQAPRNTERPRPPKRVRRDPPADACTEAAHAHAAGCVARPAKPCHAGGPAKVLVGGCWAAGSPSVQTEVVERAEAHRGQAAGTPRRRALDETGCGEHARDPAKTVTGCAAARSRGVTSQYLCHTEPHATIAHATGVPRKLSADAMRACSPHCGARDDTVCGASESFVAGASSAPSAKRARTGAGFAGGGCGAGGAWDAAQVPQMRAANVGVRPARWHNPCHLHHAGTTPATMHHAGMMLSPASDNLSDATHPCSAACLAHFLLWHSGGRAAGPRECCSASLTSLCVADPARGAAVQWAAGLGRPGGALAAPAGAGAQRCAPALCGAALARP